MTRRMGLCAVMSLMVAVSVAVALAMMAGIATSVDARQSESVTGRWDITVPSPHGVLTLELELKQDGTAVSGTLLNFRSEKQPVKGESKGGVLTLETTSGGEVALTGNLKGDGTLAGDLSTPQGDLKWTAKRVKN